MSCGSRSGVPARGAGQHPGEALVRQEVETVDLQRSEGNELEEGAEVDEQRPPP
jgi:hypothetical protein